MDIIITVEKEHILLPWKGTHTFLLPDWSVLLLSVFSKIEDYVGEILVFWRAEPAWQETSGKRNQYIISKIPILNFPLYRQNIFHLCDYLLTAQVRNTNLRCDGRNIFFNIGTPSFHLSDSRWNCRGRNCGVMTNCWACAASTVILLLNLRVYQFYCHSTISFVLWKGIDIKFTNW